MRAMRSGRRRSDSTGRTETGTARIDVEEVGEEERRTRREGTGRRSPAGDTTTTTSGTTGVAAGTRIAAVTPDMQAVDIMDRVSREIEKIRKFSQGNVKY